MKVVRLSNLDHQVVIFMTHLTRHFISLFYISLALFHSLEQNKMSDCSEQSFLRGAANWMATIKQLAYFQHFLKL